MLLLEDAHTANGSYAFEFKTSQATSYRFGSSKSMINAPRWVSQRIKSKLWIVVAGYTIYSPK